LDGAEYHVDAGYAAPFLEPVPLHQLPWEFVQSRTRYVLDRLDRGDSLRMTAYHRGERVHGYVARATPRSHEFFRPVVDASFAPGSTFTSTLRITRFFDDGVVELKGTSLTTARRGIEIETQLRDPAELESAVALDLAMPRCPIRQALGILERAIGKSLFDASM
jgi:arylamine N-acetyltransferase